jgi:hypothetical protein
MAEQEGTMSEYVLRLTDALIKQTASKEKLHKLAIGAFVRAATLPVNPVAAAQSAPVPILRTTKSALDETNHLQTSISGIE